MECAIIRFLIDIVWKRIPPVSDEFFSTFLLTLNTLLGMVFGWLSLITGEGGEVRYRLTGLDVRHYSTTANVNVRISPAILTVGLTPIALVVMIQGFGKLVKWIQKAKANKVNPNVDVIQQHGQQVQNQNPK